MIFSTSSTGRSNGRFLFLLILFCLVIVYFLLPLGPTQGCGRSPDRAAWHGQETGQSCVLRKFRPFFIRKIALKKGSLFLDDHLAWFPVHPVFAGTAGCIPTVAPIPTGWEHNRATDTYEEILVYLWIDELFIDGLSFYRTDGHWQTTATATGFTEPCRTQYLNLINYSLSMLNDHTQPLTFDNQPELAPYDHFLLTRNRHSYFFPLIAHN